MNLPSTYLRFWWSYRLIDTNSIIFPIIMIVVCCKFIDLMYACFYKSKESKAKD